MIRLASNYITRSTIHAISRTMTAATKKKTISVFSFSDIASWMVAVGSGVFVG